MKTLRIGTLVLALAAQTAAGAIFAVTGHTDPGLVTFDEDSLQQNGGSHQNIISGHDLAFSSSGRLFSISSEFLREFDPYTLQVINQQARSSFLSGITAGNGSIYSLTGSHSPQLITFDPDTLLQTAGTLQSTISFPQDLTFDNSGRLFALTQDSLIEFDPTTLQIVNQQARSPFLSGIAARDGVIFSLTGTATPELITFDADTLLQTAGTLQNTISGGQELAFGAAGRLFGSSQDFLLEFDASTLQIINQENRPNFQTGLAVGVPEPSSILLLFMAVTYFGARRNRQG